MTATYIKSGFNYLPAIKHIDGRKEILYGQPIATIKRAKEYARFEIYTRKIQNNWNARFDEMREGKKVRVSERIYYDVLGSVPLLKYTQNGFIAGEAYSGNLYYHFWKEDGIIYGQLKQVIRTNN